jgi:hypothetical protein
MKKQIKCEHSKITITRYDMPIINTSEFHGRRLVWNESSEWNLFEAEKIVVKCLDCGRKWYGKKKEDFPEFVAEWLDEEERQFGEL